MPSRRLVTVLAFRTVRPRIGPRLREQTLQSSTPPKPPKEEASHCCRIMRGIQSKEPNPERLEASPPRFESFEQLLSSLDGAEVFGSRRAEAVELRL